MSVSKSGYNFWLQGRYSKWPELSSFRESVETEFEKKVIPYFNGTSNTEREQFLDAAKKTYLELAKKKESQDETIQRNSRIVVAVIFIGIFFYVTFILNDIEPLYITVFLVMLVWIAIVFWFQKKKDDNKIIKASAEGSQLIKIARDSGIYKPIKEGQFEDIVSELKSLGAKIYFKINLDNIYFDPRVKSSPAISEIALEGDESIIITLTRESIALFKKNLPRFRALYLHEFGHLVQKDTKLWLSKLVPLEIFLPLVKMDTSSEDFGNDDQVSIDHSEIDYSILDSDYEIDEAVGQIGIPGLSLLLKPYLKKAQIKANKNIFIGKRHESEYLSDFCSVAYSGTLEIMNLPQESFKQDESDDNHPSTDIRVISLKYHLVQSYYRLNNL